MLKLYCFQRKSNPHARAWAADPQGTILPPGDWEFRFAQWIDPIRVVDPHFTNILERLRSDGCFVEESPRVSPASSF
jgi:hypothetical protein